MTGSEQWLERNGLLQYRSKQPSDIAHASLLHDVGAMILDCTVANSKYLADFLVGASGCHELKHIGLAEVRGYLDRAKSHLAEVNGWTDEQVELHLASQIEVWHRRSAVSWALDLECLRAHGVASDPRSARKR